MSQRYCTQCGGRLPETAAFCPECGTRVEQAAAAQEPTPGAAVPERAPARRFPAWPLALVGVALVIGLVVLFAALRPRQSAATVGVCAAGEACAGTAIPDVHNDEGIPYADVRRISVEEARALYDAGQALFVDVRDAESYAAARIPASLHLPLSELEAGIPPLPRDAEIITYCT